MRIPKNIPAAMNKKLSNLSFEELDALMETLGCPAVDTRSEAYRASRARVTRLVDTALNVTTAFQWLSVLETVPVTPHLRIRQAGAPSGNYQVTKWRSQSGVFVDCEALFSSTSTAGRLLQITTIRPTDIGKLALVFFPKPSGIQLALVVLRRAEGGGAATGWTLLEQVPEDTLLIVALAELNSASVPDLPYLERAMVRAGSDLDWMAWTNWLGSQVVRGTLTRSQADTLQSDASTKRGALARMRKMIVDRMKKVEELESPEESSEGPTGVHWVDEHDDGTEPDKPRRE